VSRIAERLDREAGAGRFEVINAGISGSSSGPLADHFEKEWAALEPELVVVDLGTNDDDTAAFRRNLERIAALDEAKGTRTLFVLEANDADNPHLRRNHEAMRDVAAAHGIPLTDLHRAILARSDDGFLWWDFVHLSSFGQKLAADVLFSDIRRLLPPGGT
jgi:lysophospholipase L1-like esterase